MTKMLHSVRFPGESERYRQARNELLQAELKLRQHLEEVAAQRRALPLGGEPKDDYVFEEGGSDLDDAQTATRVRLSELFRPGTDSLILYSFMYGPTMKEPCPMCTSLLDGLSGTALHATQAINFAVVARSPIQRIREFARLRGWRNLRLLSSERNTYNLDYQAETTDGQQVPSLNVFVRRDGKIFHFYNTELFFVPPEAGQDPRHMDSLWPLWNLLDLTPQGRGRNWYPALKYAD